MVTLSSFLSISLTLPSTSISLHSFFPIRLQSITLGFHSTLGQRFQINTPIVVHKRGAIITKASADSVQPAAAAGDGESTAEQEKIGIQDLPLESKLQLKLEQKLKMKLAKKLRLRRARLMRKRSLRKKGRWPPSKMNKLKNV